MVYPFKQATMSLASCVVDVRYLDDEIKIYSFILDELENLIDLMVVIYRKETFFNDYQFQYNPTVNSMRG